MVQVTTWFNDTLERAWREIGEVRFENVSTRG
jgi:hypothetical protein